MFGTQYVVAELVSAAKGSFYEKQKGYVMRNKKDRLTLYGCACVWTGRLAFFACDIRPLSSGVQSCAANWLDLYMVFKVM